MRFHNALLGADTNNSWLRVVSALFLCLWAGPARKRVYMQGSVYQRGGGALAVNLDVQGVVRNQGLTVLRLDRAAGLLGRLWSWYAPRGVEGREGVVRCSVAGFCGVLTRFGRVAEICKGLVWGWVWFGVGFCANCAFSANHLTRGFRMRFFMMVLVGLVLGCGDAALHNAAFDGDLETVKELVGSGAAVDARDEAGLTALHYAAAEGHVSVVEYLVGQGADVNATDNEGWMALHWAALHYAAWFGHLDVVKFLVGAGADLEARDEDGRTARDLAAYRGHTDVVEYLESL